MAHVLLGSNDEGQFDDATSPQNIRALVVCSQLFVFFLGYTDVQILSLFAFFLLSNLVDSQFESESKLLLLCRCVNIAEHVVHALGHARHVHGLGGVVLVNSLEFRPSFSLPDIFHHLNNKINGINGTYVLQEFGIVELVEGIHSVGEGSSRSAGGTLQLAHRVVDEVRTSHHVVLEVFDLLKEEFIVVKLPVRLLRL